MEELLLKNFQALISGGLGSMVGFAVIAAVFLGYRILNKWLDKRRVSRETLNPDSVSDLKPDGNGGGSKSAELIVLRELTACNDRHKAGWKEVEFSIVGAVREEIRKDYNETRESFRDVHKRIDTLFEIIPKKIT